MKSLLFSLLLVTSVTNCSTTARAVESTYSAETAPQAVLYMSGVIDARQEVAASTFPYSFREKAIGNLNLANMFRDKPEAYAYFKGRADAFNQAADEAGEPTY